jgi:glycosyltransferase involved in cell wall biosynthesis
VHAFFACSDDDRDILESLNGGTIKGFTVPNGVDTAARPFDVRPDKVRSRQVLFCGSLYYGPNREGLLWFHKEIWPLVVGRQPGARLVVVGWGARRELFPALCADPTVDFVGQVDDSIPYYYRAGVVVVPLLEGSGTRLKILDSMSLGNPVVSTSIGAQGIGATDGRDLLLADESGQFAEAVCSLLSDADVFERMRRSARTLVEETYDWRIVGRAMARSMASLLSSGSDVPEHMDEIEQA